MKAISRICYKGRKTRTLIEIATLHEKALFNNLADESDRQSARQTLIELYSVLESRGVSLVRAF